METKSDPFVGYRLDVQAIISCFGKSRDGKEMFCLESVMFDDELIRDHIWVKGETGKGKGCIVKLQAKIGQYFHNGQWKYNFAEYKFL